jgi:hypothetical protein
MKPRRRLRPARKAGLNGDENVEHSRLNRPAPATGWII